MSYAAIPTPNTFGTKRLPGLHGLSCCGARRGLGQVQVVDLTQASVDPGVASSLVAWENEGILSASQLEAVIQDSDSQDAAEILYEQTAAQVSATNESASASSQPSSPATILVGTVLKYTANVEPGFSTWTVAGAISKISAYLAGNYPELSIQPSSTGTGSILSTTMSLSLDVQVVSGGGFGSAVDVKKILDGAVYSTQAGIAGSNIAIIQVPGQAAVNPYQPGQQQPIVSPAAETLSQWASNNWPLLAGGVLGIVVLGAVLKKL